MLAKAVIESIMADRISAFIVASKGFIASSNEPSSIILDISGVPKNMMTELKMLRMALSNDNTRKMVMPVGRFADDNRLPEGIIYQIVLFTSAGHAGLEELRGVSPVYERLGANLRYTYSTGLYRHYSSALLDLNTVRVLGFPQAHIVAYRDGRPVSVQLARQEE